MANFSVIKTKLKNDNIIFCLIDNNNQEQVFNNFSELLTKFTEESAKIEETNYLYGFETPDKFFRITPDSAQRILDAYSTGEIDNNNVIKWISESKLNKYNNFKKVTLESEDIEKNQLIFDEINSNLKIALNDVYKNWQNSLNHSLTIFNPYENIKVNVKSKKTFGDHTVIDYTLEIDKKQSKMYHLLINGAFDSQLLKTKKFNLTTTNMVQIIFAIVIVILILIAGHFVFNMFGLK